MASKIIGFIALFLAIFFLVSTQSAAARELSDQTSYNDPPTKESKKIDDDLIGVVARFDCPNGCCGHNPYCRCC